MPKPIKIKVPRIQANDPVWVKDTKQYIINLANAVQNTALEADGVTCTEQGGKLSVIPTDPDCMFKVYYEFDEPTEDDIIYQKFIVINSHEDKDDYDGSTPYAGYFITNNRAILPIACDNYIDYDMTKEILYVYLRFVMKDGTYTEIDYDAMTYYSFVIDEAKNKYEYDVMDDEYYTYMPIARLVGYPIPPNSTEYNDYRVEQMWTGGAMFETDVIKSTTEIIHPWKIRQNPNSSSEYCVCMNEPKGDNTDIAGYVVMPDGNALITNSDVNSGNIVHPCKGTTYTAVTDGYYAVITVVTDSSTGIYGWNFGTLNPNVIINIEWRDLSYGTLPPLTVTASSADCDKPVSHGEIRWQYVLGQVKDGKIIQMRHDIIELQPVPGYWMNFDGGAYSSMLPLPPDNQGPYYLKLDACVLTWDSPEDCEGTTTNTTTSI